MSVCLLATGLAVVGCGDDGESTDDSILTIASPEDDAYVNDRTVVVEGTVEEGYDVEVNGDLAHVAGTEWEIELEFDSDGPAPITAKAGGEHEAIEVVIDTTLPKLELHSPDRGTAIDSEETSGTVTVAGEVVDPGASGVLLVDINGSTAEVADDGSFQHEITVTRGFNLIEAKVFDRARNETEANRALIFGPLTDPRSAIDEAAQVAVDDPSGIDAITEVIEEYVEPELVTQFALTAIEQMDDFGGVEIDIRDIAIDWDDLELQLEPTDGYLEVTIQISELKVDGEFAFGDGGSARNATVDITEMTVELEASIDADDNELDVEITDNHLHIPEDGVSVDIEDMDRFESALELLVEIGIGVAFEQLVSSVMEQNLFDPDLLTQEVEFMDSTIAFSLLLQDVLITPNGISIVLGLEFPADAHEHVDEMPGALHRPITGTPGTSMDKPMMFHTNRTAVDRLLHGIWETGLFHQRIGNDDLAEFQVPFELTADGLGSLLDSRIRDIHSTNTPAELRLRPLLSPVIEFGSDETGRVEIGDFLVDIFLVPEDDFETLVVTVALHLDVEVQLELDGDEIGFDIDIDATGDVADEPQFEFDRADTVSFITELIELAPSFVQGQLAMDAETSLEWATIDRPTVKTHGQYNDQVTVGIEIEPATDYIEDDDVDEPEETMGD